MIVVHGGTSRSIVVGRESGVGRRRVESRAINGRAMHSNGDAVRKEERRMAMDEMAA